MKRYIALLASLALAFGLVTGTVVGQEFGEEEGIGWFNDETEAESEFGTGFGESEELYGDEEFGTEGALMSDDYGTYDSDYDWTTDDGWFDSWYGESDELF